MNTGNQNPRTSGRGVVNQFNDHEMRKIEDDLQEMAKENEAAMNLIQNAARFLVVALLSLAAALMLSYS